MLRPEPVVWPKRELASRFAKLPRLAANVRCTDNYQCICYFRRPQVLEIPGQDFMCYRISGATGVLV